MFQYEDLMWLISFPLVCAIMLWFSLDLAVLVRVGGGRRRRANARRAIERIIMSSPALTTAPVITTSPIAPTTPTDRYSKRFDESGLQGYPDVSGYSSSSANGKYGEKHRAPSQGSACTSTPGPTARRQESVRHVVVPTTLRIATRSVVRRAVVIVGGDFARSPRMQYHAASLARSGLFDEVLLVGLTYGNQLSEDLLTSGEPQPQSIVTWDDPDTTKGAGYPEVVVQGWLESPDLRPGSGCVVSTRYLTTPPSPPEWLQTVFPLLSLHWVVCTLYRVVALTGLFFLQTMRATATRINEHGQLLVTDLILIQTPPAVPFVLLVKCVVCPLAFMYNILLYYGVVVPAAWMNPAAMRDVRQQCRLQSLRFSAAEEKSPDNRRHLQSQRGLAHTSLWGMRRWVFYPAIVVDWHNFGHTILKQNQRPTMAVALYKLFEMNVCAGHVNVTVSHAMRRALECAYPKLRRQTANAATAEGKPRVLTPAATSPSVQADGATSVTRASANAVTVLYDVAPSFFRPAPRSRCVREVLEGLLLRPRATNLSFSDAFTPSTASDTDDNAAYALISKADLEEKGWGISGPPAWVFADAAVESAVMSSTGASSATPAMMTTLPRRGIMVIGSTSWTGDDDYSILIQALQRLDHRLRHESSYAGSNSHSSFGPGSGGPADLWVLITGKGETRQRFEDAVRAAKLSSHVVVSTYYAQSYEEYSLLLGAADVGLCLHFSSSGLDLPMKGVDMLGAGLPIIVLEYPAIGELIGCVTRVLATEAAEPHRWETDAQGFPRVSGAQAAAVQPTLQECERGWLFRSSADLELLLSSLICLVSTRESLSDGASSLLRSLPTPLSVMKRRAQDARLRANTWEENWMQVLLPVLKQVV